MTRSLRRPLTACAFALLATACATTPPAGPTRFYASYSGDHPPTKPLFEAVDTRMRLEPDFVRDFREPMSIYIVDGAPTADGRLRYAVRTRSPRALPIAASASATGPS